MKVSEVIDQLKVGDEVWVKAIVDGINESECLPLVCDVSEITIWFDEDEEIELAFPDATTERVVLSKSQAEQVEGYRSGTLLNFVLAMDGRTDLETLVNARLNGYSVAPSYVVVVGSQYFLYFKQGVHLSELGTCEHAREFENIEDAKAVAQLINGKVKEVE